MWLRVPVFLLIAMGLLDSKESLMLAGVVAGS